LSTVVQQAEYCDTVEAAEKFRAAICDSGLHPPETIVDDGKLHRFASNGKRGDDAGWYFFYTDGIPAGAFGCWRSGVKQNWRASIGRSLTLQEVSEHRVREASIKLERDAEKSRQRAKARETAVEVWRAAKPAADDHPYLMQKGVKAHGLREYDGALVIRVTEDAELHSLQFVEADGSKRFLTGGRVRACYFPIGEPGDTLCIVEGYATGASVHEATEFAVAAAFNAGNLLPVSRALRSKYPETRLIVCADDDTRTDGNPGMTKAREAAAAAGAMLAVPDFGDERPEGSTDFNDLARSAGLEAVRRCIEEAESVAEDWPEPQPLPNVLPSVESLGLAMLPKAFARWVEDVSARMQAPPDYAAVGLMVALGTVVGRQIAIRPKATDDWTVVANLWGGIVGRPGVLKTPLFSDI
jgi:putative DNA primase/helicase